MHVKDPDSTSPSQRAYAYIRSKLEGGEYAPGTRLVTRTIAKEIGSSLNPVREALGRLSTQGWIDHTPGSGSSVRQPSRDEIMDLYSLREALESHAAYLAATEIQATELAELDAICAQWQQLAKQFATRADAELDTPEVRRRWIASEKRFHRIIIFAAGNNLLARACEDYLVLSGIFEQHLQQTSLLTLELVQQVVTSHTALVESLRQGDCQAAREQTATMIRHGCTKTLHSG